MLAKKLRKQNSAADLIREKEDKLIKGLRILPIQNYSKFESKFKTFRNNETVHSKQNLRRQNCFSRPHSTPKYMRNKEVLRCS